MAGRKQQTWPPIKRWLLATLCACVLLHLGTFFFNMPAALLILPLTLLFCAVLCGDPVQDLGMPRNALLLTATVLLAYAITLFAHLYLATGGATGAAMVNGVYGYSLKGSILRIIPEAEYRSFPTHVTRTLSAWIATAATFALGAIQIPKATIPS